MKLLDFNNVANTNDWLIRKLGAKVNNVLIIYIIHYLHVLCRQNSNFEFRGYETWQNIAEILQWWSWQHCYYLFFFQSFWETSCTERKYIGGHFFTEPIYQVHSWENPSFDYEDCKYDKLEMNYCHVFHSL